MNAGPEGEFAPFLPVSRPWLEPRVIANRDGLLVVDKPHRIVVHGGDTELGDDLVTRLKTWLTEVGEDVYLGVHQRLDKDASGVILFARAKHRNAAVAAAFERHELERVYVAAVSGRLPASSGELVHQLRPEKGGKTQVVRHGGQRAVAAYRVLRQVGTRTLVELRPQTGRTHQLRVQLAAIGAPIAGDRLYDGAAAPRLMLHAAELGLLGERFQAPTPPEFEQWLTEESTLGPPETVGRKLTDAAWLRQPLTRDCDAFRLANDEPDLLPNVVVDRYGDYATLNVSGEEAYERRAELADAVMALGARGVYLKVRVRADVRRLSREEVAPPRPEKGDTAPDRFVVHEGDMRFGVRLGAGLSSGLFLDQRDNRRLVRELARGGRMLNLFSYTGSFSVAAAKGGAMTTSVDVSVRALEQARDNLRLNGFGLSGFDSGPHRLVKADVVQWLQRARRERQRFDLIVLDPPSFGSRGGKGVFSVASSFTAVARDALSLLTPGGRLLAVTNHRKTSPSRLRKWLHQAARDAHRDVAQLKDLRSGLDCPPAFDGPLPSKSVLLTVA